jgi:hypothetical protein
LAFCVREITHNGVSGCLRGQPLLDAMAAQIKADFNGTGNLGTRTVAYDRTTITIPAIALPGGGSFIATYCTRAGLLVPPLPLPESVRLASGR